MSRYYTGIGSRQTPENYLSAMTAAAVLLAKKGYTLRSGGADGADTAFERGCLDAKGPMEIFLPWKKFNGRPAADGYLWSSEDDLLLRAKEIAAAHHPVWDTLTDSVKRMHARNVHQVLGQDLQTPSEFVVCYAPFATSDDMTQWRGGTAQALRIAVSIGVPAYNLASENGSEDFLRFLRTLS